MHTAFAPSPRRPAITVGNVTIRWALAMPGLQAGWALPGGARTQNEAYARAVGSAISAISTPVPPLTAEQRVRVNRIIHLS